MGHESFLYLAFVLVIVIWSLVILITLAFILVIVIWSLVILITLAFILVIVIWSLVILITHYLNTLYFRIVKNALIPSRQVIFLPSS
jgi:hypothetical protein